jgi:hypothetical protein
LINVNDQNVTDEQRRRVRRSAILLGLVALSFYVAFIVMSVMRS